MYITEVLNYTLYDPRSNLKVLRCDSLRTNLNIVPLINPYRVLILWQTTPINWIEFDLRYERVCFQGCVLLSKNSLAIMDRTKGAKTIEQVARLTRPELSSERVTSNSVPREICKLTVETVDYRRQYRVTDSFWDLREDTSRVFSFAERRNG